MIDNHTFGGNTNDYIELEEFLSFVGANVNIWNKTCCFEANKKEMPWHILWQRIRWFNCEVYFPENFKPLKKDWMVD